MLSIQQVKLIAGRGGNQCPRLDIYVGMTRRRPADSSPHVTTDRRLFNDWLTDLASGAIETTLQRQRQRTETRHPAHRLVLVPSRRSRPQNDARLSAAGPSHSATGGVRRRAPERIVVMRENGMTYREIATHLGVPVGTVRSRLFRARRRMYLPHDVTVGSAPGAHLEA